MIELRDVVVRFPLNTKKNVTTHNDTDSNIRIVENSSYIYSLSNINLKLEQGDRVGLIGKNGAGKTTLLRVLSEILPPTSGEISINGNVISILNLSAGLLMAASCSENIRLKGLFFGFKKEKLD